LRESSGSSFPAPADRTEDPGGPQKPPLCQNSVPKLLDAALADVLLGVALRGLAERAVLRLRTEPAPS
jgi:hypothetical protein